MGIASGAVGMLQKVLAKGNTAQGFDSQLQAAIAGTQGSGSTLLAKLAAAKGSLDDESLKALLANPQAFPLLQYLSLLNNLGLSSADAGTLLTGKAEGISDDGLKAILSSLGIEDARITELMADPDLVAGLKASLAESVSGKVQVRLGGDAEDMEQFISKLTGDQATYEAAAGLLAGAESSQALKDMKGSLKMSDEISQKTVGIRQAVEAFLNNPSAEQAAAVAAVFGETLTAEAGSATSGQAAQGPQANTGADVQEALSILETDFAIPKKTLQDLFFSPDAQTRQAALDEATAQITEYLKANADTGLPGKAVDALGLLKGALSKEEFAKVENTLKSFNQDPAIITQPFSFDRHVLTSVAKGLGNEQGSFQARYAETVVDQMKQAFATNMKAGNSSMTLELHPPMLGRVDVNVRMEDGQLMASFKTDQIVTRDILQQNMHILKDALTEQGIKATQFVVTTDTFTSRDHRGAYAAWAGFDHGREGSNRQGANQDTPGSGSGRGEYVHAGASVQGYTERSGLDIFA
jgi:flagellar hook-length control protein FliK